MSAFKKLIEQRKDILGAPPVFKGNRIEELDPDFCAATVPDIGWGSESDGKLLSKAEKGVNVFITCDRNLNF